MPRALDPNNTFDVSLDSDKNKPDAERPVFVIRHLNGRAWLSVAEIHASIIKEPDAAHAISSLFAALKIAIVDWRGMIWPKADRLPDGAVAGEAVKFSQDNFDLVIDPKEAMELLVKIINGTTLSESDEKKSESRSQSNTGKPAKPADPADAATAPTLQVP